ncbi:LLM class flavin-dependent oxidoreductase [Streptomyces mirabilis]|uniref:Flavin-dependent oxidoreductase, luciferase family (Includes alkanesulfonate monooxygenase SsuD and methylene tetrahydromethanopterin reductase) n=1 Tax=Streptomyces mirabilis TaxID=68239 RepID=A0A1I2E456_9ACTN|nr:LLM class flavin-dependent oxidoreductase [Streptomyces mirabilis]SFE87010.1 Flavin-dependent oxidoreductase, luciferase family (includes alkanesulfonate monooxygenase SsuD and methylene tetrahydromethanopterin reductase) [Streptomyces mirabilis]
MTAFALRFDFRNPEQAGTTMADRYAAALDMAEWADRLGCARITVSEHHGSPDGYLPAPVPMLAAMAARTTNVRFLVAALIAPFHDPLLLAEEMIVLDNLSRGRADLVVAGGYVHEEFALFDVPMNERAKRVTEVVTTLKAAFTGEEFTYRGRTVRLTPAPFRPGGPSVSLGGSTEPAARRAARIADGFIPSVSEVWEYYRDEVLKLGRPDPGPSPIGRNQVVALAEDPDKGWEQMAPFFLHETNAYGAWRAQDDLAAPFRSVTGTDELRESSQYRVLTPERFVAELKSSPRPFTQFHPLCGGMPMELAWSSLRLFEREVLPAFT